MRGRVETDVVAGFKARILRDARLATLMRLFVRAHAAGDERAMQSILAEAVEVVQEERR